LANAIRSFRGRAALFITADKSELSTLPQAVTKLALFEFTCEDLNETDRQAFAESVQKGHSTNFSPKWLADSVRVSFFSRFFTDKIFRVWFFRN
jgi:hypothetical protein